MWRRRWPVIPRPKACNPAPYPSPAPGMQERWWRLQFYQAQSQLLTPLFASRSRVLRHARNLFMYPACHTPGLQRYIHAVLCGAQSPNLAKLWTTIPEAEFMGFLEDHDALQHVMGAGVREAGP